jgi:hypothetical protein
MLGQHALHLREKIREKLNGARKNIRPPRIVFGSMPMIMFDVRLPKARSQRLDAMSVIEPKEPVSIGVMQGEGVAQSMGALWRRLHALDFEFEPIALFEVVDVAVEAQQKFKRVFVGNGAPSLHIISCEDTHIAAGFQGVCFARHYCTRKVVLNQWLGFCAIILSYAHMNNPAIACTFHSWLFTDDCNNAQFYPPTVPNSPLGNRHALPTGRASYAGYTQTAPDILPLQTLLTNIPLLYQSAARAVDERPTHIIDAIMIQTMRRMSPSPPLSIIMKTANYFAAQMCPWLSLSHPFLSLQLQA